MLCLGRSSDQEKGEAINAPKPISNGGRVQKTYATRLKPAASASDTPSNASQRVQKNCHDPTLPGALGKNEPTVMRAKSPAACR
jgi:hypothetical protein